MTAECTYDGDKWTGEVVGYCDIEHLVELKRVDGSSTVADDLKG